jgi:hypothetical protein
VATTYAFAEPPVMTLLTKAMRLWHPDLEEAEVRIGVKTASNSTSAPIKHGGYPALGKISIVSLKDRVSKKYEAELLIDAMDYSDLEAPMKLAFFDHELSHIDLIALPPNELKIAKQEKAPWWKLDDLGLPRLRSVKADLNVGDAFEAVIQRHGYAAVEWRNIDRAWAWASKHLAAAETQEAEEHEPAGSAV